MAIRSEVWADGTIVWFRGNEVHRDGGLPAIERASGTKFWYRDGKRHRDGDLPAIEWASGSRWWYRRGKIHRDGDLPAIEHASSSNSQCRDDNLHHVFPAIEWADGAKEWYQNDMPHRDLGPAVVRANGVELWFLRGVEMTEEKHARMSWPSRALVVVCASRRRALWLPAELWEYIAAAAGVCA